MNRTHLLGFGSAVAVFSPLLLSSFAAAAAAADPADISSLNTAIELERAGIKAYNDAAATKLLSPGVLALASGFIADHTIHRDALIGAVKAAGAVVTPNTAQIPYPTLASEKDIIAFALVIEKKRRRRISRSCRISRTVSSPASLPRFSASKRRTSSCSRMRSVPRDRTRPASSSK